MFSVLVQYLFILSSYPIARWVLPHIKTRQNSIYFHAIYGITCCFVLFKTGLISAMILTIVGYYILDKNPYIVMLSSYFINFMIHLLQIFYPNHPRVCNLAKMIFFKIVSTSFNLYDSRKIDLNNENEKFSKRQKICYLKGKPTFCEWLAYCFTPFGSVSPSFYEFRIFEVILETGKSERKISDESKQKAMNCLKESFLYFTIYFGFRHYFRLSFYESEFFTSLNLIFRIILVLFLGLIIYSRFFMQWKAVDAGLFEVGLLDAKILEEDEFSSLSLLNLLSKSSLKDYGKAFNHTSNIFWSIYLNSRGPDSGLKQSTFDAISFFLKPFIRGPYGGYFLGTLERKLYASAEVFLHLVAPNYFAHTFWIDFLFTQISMIANKSSIRFKTIRAFFYVNYVLFFVFWFSAAAIIVVGYFLSKKKKEKDEKKMKNE